MKEGAKVLEVGVPLRESLRWFRAKPPPSAFPTELLDWDLPWDAGVEAPGLGTGVENRAEFGRLLCVGVTDGDTALEKGLLRR